MFFLGTSKAMEHKCHLITAFALETRMDLVASFGSKAAVQLGVLDLFLNFIVKKEFFSLGVSMQCH